MKMCAFIYYANSCGIQDVSPYYVVPLLFIRDIIERLEGVDSGTIKLVGSNEASIYKAF